MDRDRFDVFTRSLGAAASRRGLGRTLAMGGLGALFGSALSALRLKDAVAAKNKKKRKKRKVNKRVQTPPVATPSFEPPPLVFNQFGCIEIGQACRGDSTLCCSGICQGTAPAAGQPDASRCAAHNAGTCRQDAGSLCTIPDPILANCNNSQACACFRTTAASNYCAVKFNGPGTSECAPCQRDADCVALGFPPTSACAPVSEGRCAGICATGMACLVPCGAASPSP